MILIDTSAWVDFFRGHGQLAARVDEALSDGDAALCGPVVTELRRGLRNAAERAKVLPLLSGCEYLAQPPHLWQEAGELGYFLARKGVMIKTLDLLIASYALSHGTPLLTGDSDFKIMKRLGLELHLVAE